MRQEFGKIQENLLITDELCLFGMCTGNITVESGGALYLHGMCTGNIEVGKDGRVVIEGMCTGNILNSGGILEVNGVIRGTLHEVAGTTEVHPKALIT